MSRKKILIIGTVGLIIYIGVSRNPDVIKWLLSIDPTVMAAMIAGGVTVVSSVYVTSSNARRAQENAAAEANRGEKSGIYKEFVMALMERLNSAKAKEGKLTEDDFAEVMHDFSVQLMIYGGPEVIKAYENWQEVGASTEREQRDGQMKMLEIFENLLFAIRQELEVSNEGLKKNALLGLIIKGGKSELDQMSRGDNS